MVPCWSTVRLNAVGSSVEKEKQLDELKAEGLSRVPDNVAAVRKLAYKVKETSANDQALAAVALVNNQPPDVRAALRRYMSFFSGPLYPRVSIGEAVTRLIMDILDGKETIVSAQVRLVGGYLGIDTHAIGAPVIVSGDGVQIAPVQLLPVEEEAVRMAAHEVKGIYRSAKASYLFQILDATRKKATS